MSYNSISLLLFSALLITACSSRSKPQVNPDGSEKTASTTTLETGARTLQTSRPVSVMDVYMVGFHPMKDHPQNQMEAHHFCRSVNEEFVQCALFDGRGKACVVFQS